MAQEMWIQHPLHLTSLQSEPNLVELFAEQLSRETVQVVQTSRSGGRLRAERDTRFLHVENGGVQITLGGRESPGGGICTS